MKRVLGFILIVFASVTIHSIDAYAQKGRGKKVNVKELKKQYWSQDEDYDVVQNRVYTKSKRLELGIYGGFIFGDPFLSNQALGFSTQYHFNEYLSVSGMYWIVNSGPSSALLKFEEQALTTTNTNLINSYLGAEVNWSLIYGKLSFLGSKILYYDLHLLGGAGQLSTESGTYFTPHLGVGQRIYINRHMAIRFDYRLMRFSEVLLEKANFSTKGQPASERVNFSNVLTIGLSFFLF